MPRKLLRSPPLPVFGLGKLSRLPVRKRAASNGRLFSSVENVLPGPCGDRGGRAVAAPRARVTSPAFYCGWRAAFRSRPRRRRGPGSKRGEVRLPLVAVCVRRVVRVALGYLMPLARDAIRARCNSLLGFFCERCEIGQRSFICFLHGLLGRFPRDRKAPHRRKFP